MRIPTPEELAALVAVAKVHAQKCYGCKTRLATRTCFDATDGYRVWICDAPKCARLANNATVEDAPNAAGLRFANAWRRR